MSALAGFILSNMEDILGEWQKFASAVASAEGMDRKALRNDAEWILTTIAKDMQTHQSAAEQEAKSKDTEPRRKNSPETAAEAHGAQRFVSGFDLNEMVSEYRALRASVIRLWTASPGFDARQAAEELTRFNEGIDQALSESVRYFAGQLDRSRELFMGVLGHDLRSPLQVIQMSAHKLLQPAGSSQREKLGTYVRDAANQMSEMLTDLLDTVRTQLGGSLPLQLHEVDLAAAAREVVSHFQVLHPERELRCNLPTELLGRWDMIRVRQVLNNLLRNALQHGNPTSPVTLSACLEGECAIVTVHNEGSPIPTELLMNIFEPLRRGDAQREAPNSFSMGIGLYIVSIIAKAHGGDVYVESSSERGTTFTVKLPVAASE
jgi:signal transduction histidine kinase